MPYSWRTLLEEIPTLFETDELDTKRAHQILANYTSVNQDWKKYITWNDHVYTRNLVDTGNGRYNLMILCWNTGQGSSIHDHSNSHCFVKILQGQLKETKYKFPEHENEEETLMKFSEHTHNKDDVSYMSDDIGLHRMENPSHSDGTVTLHLYIPPYQTCHAFDEHTGRKHECNVTFHTIRGKKANGDENPFAINPLSMCS